MLVAAGGIPVGIIGGYFLRREITEEPAVDLVIEIADIPIGPDLAVDAECGLLVARDRCVDTVVVEADDPGAVLKVEKGVLGDHAVVSERQDDLLGCDDRAAELACLDREFILKEFGLAGCPVLDAEEDLELRRAGFINDHVGESRAAVEGRSLRHVVDYASFDEGHREDETGFAGAVPADQGVQVTEP